jgi:hypothetical protein
MHPFTPTIGERLASPVLATLALHDVLSDWFRAGYFTQRDMRKVEADARAMSLAAYVAANDVDPLDREPGHDASVAYARLKQARLLLRARACHVIGSSKMAKTILARAANGRRSKVMRQHRDVIIRDWCGPAEHLSPEERAA